MTGTQKQLGNKVQISGRIRNFKKVATKTKRPMAVFTIGAEDAKCFDFIVSEAETYAVSQEWVRLSGRRSNHDGHVEFVADKIVPASLNKDSRSVDCREVFAEPPNQKQIPIRESSNIVENLCGVVGDLRTVPTQSGRLMVTFMVGSVRCKAFGDFAAAVQNANGKQIEVSARKGSFQGITEYAVEIVKTINGSATNLTDTHFLTPEGHISRTTQTPEAINPTMEINSAPFEQLVDTGFGFELHSSAGMVPMPEQYLPVEPGLDSSREGQMEPSATTKEDLSAQKALETHDSSLPAPDEEALIEQRMQSFRDVYGFPISYLGYWTESSSRVDREAARRVLEERAKKAETDNCKSEDFMQVEAA